MFSSYRFVNVLFALFIMFAIAFICTMCTVKKTMASVDTGKQEIVQVEPQELSVEETQRLKFLPEVQKTRDELFQKAYEEFRAEVDAKNNQLSDETLKDLDTIHEAIERLSSEQTVQNKNDNQLEGILEENQEGKQCSKNGCRLF